MPRPSRLGSVARGSCLVPTGILAPSNQPPPSDVPRAPTGPVSGCEMSVFRTRFERLAEHAAYAGHRLGVGTRSRSAVSGTLGSWSLGPAVLQCFRHPLPTRWLILIVDPPASDCCSAPGRVRCRPPPRLQLDPWPKTPSPSPTRRLPLAAGGRAGHHYHMHRHHVSDLSRDLLYQARRRILVPVTTPRCRPRLSTPR